MPYSRLFYHFIWATKDRLPLISEIRRPIIYSAIKTKVAALQGITHALNGMPNHIHLVATVLPKISLADFIGQIKGSSSHQVTNLTGEAFSWQSEYGVLTVSESHLSQVIQYVEKQQHHHAENSLEKHLEAFNE